MLYDPAWLVQARSAVRTGEAWAAAAWSTVKTEADQWVDMASLSVMQKSVLPPSGSKHSYMSLDK